MILPLGQQQSEELGKVYGSEGREFLLTDRRVMYSLAHMSQIGSELANECVNLEHAAK